MIDLFTMIGMGAGVVLTVILAVANLKSPGRRVRLDKALGVFVSTNAVGWSIRVLITDVFNPGSGNSTLVKGYAVIGALAVIWMSVGTIYQHYRSAFMKKAKN